jgi:ATP/maltotriose-dependent transcriptional regulator MalT
MMTYFQDTHFDTGEFYAPTDHSYVRVDRSTERTEIHLLSEKLEVPRFRGLVQRPRLEDLLRKSIEQFPATLISGRAGTGKTATAAEFARTQDNVAWYSVESSDVEWNVFSIYFAACVLRASNSKLAPCAVLPAENVASQSSMATLLINVFAEAETDLLHEPLLIVLDGVHHLFDAPWFGEFFGLLLSSLPDTANLLLLCRSKPPNPLWRLRSKQQLNVIDEKLLAFSLPESAELAQKYGLARAAAERAHAETFGRISKFLQIVGRGKVPRTR